MSKFTMLIGPAGCGKSTYSKSLHITGSNSVILSSDEIRKELFGDESCQLDNSRVFLTMTQRAREYLLNGANVIWDSTNISRKRRIGILQQLPKGTECHAVVIATDIDSIKTNNASRDRVVNEDAIMAQLKTFQAPWFTEGFKTIRVVGNKHNSFHHLIEQMQNCTHENPHHRDGSVWDHCYAMLSAYLADTLDGNFYTAYDNTTIISDACKFHDCGKPYTKEYDEDHVAHYKGHAGVGAYLYLTCIDDRTYTVDSDTRALKTAVVIGEHMRMLQKDFNINKLRRTIGNDLVELCEKLKYYDRTYA